MLKVAIEGPDYSGKTTVCNVLEEKFQYPRFKQPGVEFIRNLISSELEDKDPSEEILCLAFALDRTIQDKYLHKEEVFITDRSVISSLVTQGNVLGLEAVGQINQFCRKPDLIIYLDISELELKRRMAERAGSDYYDHKALETRRDYQGLMQMISSVHNVKRVQVNRKTPYKLAEEIHNIIEEELNC